MMAITQWYAGKPVLAFYGRVSFLWVADVVPCIYLWIGEYTTETKSAFLKTLVCSHPKVSQKNNISQHINHTDFPFIYIPDRNMYILSSYTASEITALKTKKLPEKGGR